MVIKPQFVRVYICLYTHDKDCPKVPLFLLGCAPPKKNCPQKHQPKSLQTFGGTMKLHATSHKFIKILALFFEECLRGKKNHPATQYTCGNVIQDLYIYIYQTLYGYKCKYRQKYVYMQTVDNRHIYLYESMSNLSHGTWGE